ncbi:Fic family protein [Neolewinella xylanilytica]|uniref:Fic family protein n=1 Tax=Neolewinella xylanilytica TaxID=1514080 RepID=A0A2S6HZN6_9BACT|nr:Fic family protein [Neolewinella xylanilytica]PPK83795.1 Fic family protein [Neolewinella xylanilytica]
MELKLNFDFATTQRIIRKIGYIDSFKGRWAGLELSESKLLKELKQIATIASIGSSTRIEGATLSNEEVKELLKSVSIGSLKDRDEQEVYGYYEVLELILDSYPEIDIRVNHIHHLHNLLLKASTKDEYHRGGFKQLSNKVVANYPDGEQKIIFNTTEPHLVVNEMEAIVGWTNQELEKDEIHPLIVISAFVYEFLSIHPYQDGNGRLSRLLTTLLLLKNGYDFMMYASMETEIEKRKKQYYNVLMECQRKRGSGEEKIGVWVEFFLNTLQESIEILESRYDEIKNKKSYLTDRQQQIIRFIEDQEPVKVSDIHSAFMDTTIYTIRKEVEYLKKENIIQQVGKGKATIYYKKK